MLLIPIETKIQEFIENTKTCSWYQLKLIETKLIETIPIKHKNSQSYKNNKTYNKTHKPKRINSYGTRPNELIFDDDKTNRLLTKI